MSLRSEERRENENGSGLGGFLRSLLSGIPWSESATGHEVHRLPTPAGRSLKVHNANGRTRVIGEDREDVEVRAQKHARAESVEAAQRMLEEIRVVFAEVGGSLEVDVETPRQWNRRGCANIELRVPRDVELVVSASNGKVCLQGLRASVRAKSSNGSVHVSDVVGDVDVFTSNAKVACAGTCGRLIARSSNGKIELESHRGSIDASTSNGLIEVELEALGPDGIVLATSNGRIVLELPDEVDAELDIRVDNGVIRNDRQLAGQGRQINGRMRGTLGRGGTPVKLRTSNGTVSLR